MEELEQTFRNTQSKNKIPTYEISSSGYNSVHIDKTPTSYERLREYSQNEQAQSKLNKKIGTALLTSASVGIGIAEYQKQKRPIFETPTSQKILNSTINESSEVKIKKQPKEPMPVEIKPTILNAPMKNDTVAEKIIKNIETKKSVKNNDTMNTVKIENIEKTKIEYDETIWILSGAIIIGLAILMKKN